MAQNSASFFKTIPLIFFCGCTLSPSQVDFINKNVSSIFGVKIESLSKGEKKASVEEKKASEHRAVNAEFVKELFTVVLERDVATEEEFLKTINVLDQGARFEGIYNGIVYATEYREREKGVASVRALKTYAEIMTQVQLDQRYDPLKIEKPEKPDVPTPESKNPAPKQPTEVEKTSLLSANEKEGITKSHYTLKRRLGEETLKTIDLKREYREKLATWYGHFTVMLNKRGVDFGLPQRNNSDEYFHYKWALTAEEDRLKWECLNRLHVLMNKAANTK